ncbi:MAG: carbohydrate binding family 9 domain-containing protein, partial [Fimbriimonadaceae bacterium]|nr:carbohydrate binding family 9 domain-containing protein [Chitinophagales bacterium]
MKKTFNVVFLFYSFNIYSQTYATQSQPKPTLLASKITSAPKIDGKLDDAVWQTLPIATLDITYLPEYGKIPSKRTEVKVIYDNTAIYFAAMLYDDDPANIKKQLSERDGHSIADNFTVGLDTYNDDINGYRFIVSASGVQSDQRISLNSNDDRSWDAVWESDVAILDNGWSCEMKIPYSAIRFPSKEIQNWGLQFNRNVNNTGEYILWSPVDPNVYGIIAQWGTLFNLENITPPLRLSFSPYLNAGYQWTPINDDPVEYSGESILNGGLDV